MAKATTPNVRIVYTPKNPRTLNLRFGPDEEPGTLRKFQPGDVIAHGSKITAEMCGGNKKIADRNNQYLKRLSTQGEVRMEPIPDGSSRNMIDEFNQGEADPVEVYPDDKSHEQNAPAGATDGDY